MENLGNNPWENKEKVGSLIALIETSKRVLFKPAEFFTNLTIKDSIKEPYSYYYFTTMLASIMAMIVSLIIKPVPHPVFGFFFSLIFMAIVVSFAIFVGAGILHLGVMLLGGKGGYKGTLNVIAYD